MIVNQHLWMVDMVNHSKCQYGFIMVNNGDEWWFDVICGCYYNGHYPLVSSNLAETSPNKMEFFFCWLRKWPLPSLPWTTRAIFCVQPDWDILHIIYIYHIIIPPSIPIYFDMTISQYGWPEFLLGYFGRWTPMTNIFFSRGLKQKSSSWDEITRYGDLVVIYPLVN